MGTRGKEVSFLTRQEVYKDIEQTLGLVPGFFQEIPEESLGRYWELMKRYQLSETLIAVKYKQLIGLAVAAAIHCPYCAVFHSEAAKLMGATSAELEEVAELANRGIRRLRAQSFLGRRRCGLGLGGIHRDGVRHLRRGGVRPPLGQPSQAFPPL